MMKKTLDFCLLLLLCVFTATQSAFLIMVLDSDFFGSCFEGGCGYVASFFYTPLVTLLLLPFGRRWMRCWGDLSKSLAWFFLAFWLSPLLISSQAIGWLIVLWALWHCFRKIQTQTHANKPVRDLFILPKKGYP